jgi:hypothetical protein
MVKLRSSICRGNCTHISPWPPWQPSSLQHQQYMQTEMISCLSSDAYQAQATIRDSRRSYQRTLTPLCQHMPCTKGHPACITCHAAIAVAPCAQHRSTTQPTPSKLTRRCRLYMCTAALSRPQGPRQGCMHPTEQVERVRIHAHCSKPTSRGAARPIAEQPPLALPRPPTSLQRP